MSQNDMSVANANGATVRADINSALQALASANSGAAAPATTYANMWWHDDTNDILKVRDEANANWISAFSVVGTTWIPYNSGSVIGNMANLTYTAIDQNLAMSAKSFAMASATITSGTPDFATHAGNTVSITSTATANTLGTVQAGFIAVIHYGIAITVTHNATSRILPTGASITTVAGDVEIALSLGSGNWRTISYMRGTGDPLVGTAATQAQQEAGSSLTVFTSPGRQHFHPGSAKAWVHFDSTSGTPTITTDYGVSTVGDDGVGRFQVNFDTAFSSANYGHSAVTLGTAAVYAVVTGFNTDPRTTTAIDLRTVRTDVANLTDVDGTSVSFFGDYT